MKAGHLTRAPSAKVRGRALDDLMQGLQLRAKAGIARGQLLQVAWQVKSNALLGGNASGRVPNHQCTHRQLVTMGVVAGECDTPGWRTRSLSIAGRKADHANDRVWKAWRATGC
jgi:hypothetical protein